MSKRVNQLPKSVDFQSTTLKPLGLQPSQRQVCRDDALLPSSTKALWRRHLRRSSRWRRRAQNGKRIIPYPLSNEDGMSDTLADLKRKAAQLPDPERAELALSLIESLDGPADPDVEEVWRLEIERRVGQIARGEVEPIP